MSDGDGDGAPLPEDAAAPLEPLRAASTPTEAAAITAIERLSLRRSDLSFHAAGDYRDWEATIDAMGEAQQNGAWESVCSFLRVPFGPLLHTLSFVNGEELARFETACPPLARSKMCESASKAAVLAAVRRLGGASGPAARALEGRSWKQLAGWIGSPPAWCVLRELFETCGGRGWRWRDGWAATDVDVSRWFGVTVCGSRVVGLGVFGNGLRGELPGSLGSLSNLRELLLQQNELRGPVPASLGNLACLETLDLSGNAFEGPLPEALGGCARLEYVNASANDLAGPLPAGLGRLRRLEALHLDRNPRLGGRLPAALGGLGALEVCNVSHCDFCGELPGAFRSLRRLRALFLGHNRLEGGLHALAGLARGRGGCLVELYANDNHFDVGDVPGPLRELNVCFLLRNAPPAEGVGESKEDAPG